ncbi:purine nucleoside phosphorylase DeoD-type [Paenibacillus sp. E194]|jgi:purine-nucleoside phosphorylase|uniref:Purine nucleoside phosphorylase DeoD-type n=3 Tax=Paenibacillus TaxID=44249 RepID=A0A383R639_PAEAL|nr:MULTISPECIES: purine-nucleoside phosphorylase [Paenibacillus]KJB88726.1 purine nucleoside phosphorylase DeoD-type [Paenibacillus sp. E194]MCY9530823.1 purine-nucleoside phosphorylase [Paenibacillus alvei]MDT8977138.1 purine-nucleoside phosphorylase [Paenibacillus sp. chi10]OBY76730.1 purine-nucleoside phosphorylase [Paenibacillus sp. KS1]TQR45481.1 purine-nucleoside phosphorylase [Paenibacillus sp. SDF0028]
MSVHIGAKQGDVAETILLPGDPLRAKYIAETYLEDITCYNEVRGMLGFTGTYKGKRISVQGTGMGVPTTSIYVNELINEYGVKNLFRVGTCGAMQKDVHVRDVVLAQATCTDSSMNRHVFGGYDYSPIASFSLLKGAYENAVAKGMNVHVGNIFTSDMFYRDDKSVVQKLMDYGVLAVEMETTALYTLAAKYGVNALTILTVSDHLLTGEETTSQERQTTFNDMMEVALETAISL